jgi:hypothetical protein
MSKIKVNFKMPPESVAQKLYRRQQELRKKSGLPDPEEYKKRMQQYDKELGTMKKESVYVDELPDTGGDSRNIKSVVSDVDPQKKKRMDAALATANKTSELPGIAQKIKEAVWGRDKMSNLQAAHDRHAEKAIAANRAGDDQAVKVHQSKMGMIKTQMNKLRKEEKELGEAVHRIGLTVTDPNHPMVSKRKETIQKTVRVTSDDREKAIKSAIAHHKRKGYKVHDHHYIGTVNEEVEQIDEVGDTNKGQKLLRQVNKRAVDRLVSKRADTDPAYAKKAQQTHLAADSRLKEAKDSREYDVKEEVAQVDELRTSTMLRYATKANKALIGGDRNKEEKRIKGIQKANYKIQTRHSVKEDAELDEAWSQNGRNPQRGVKVGDKVRSYDFPGMHDDHYIEGHVVADNPHTYHIRVNKVVRSGKEIPVPAHMQHVEAPKGKSNFSNAYAVHKMMAKQQSVTAAPEPTTGAQKTFNQLRGKR